MWSLKHTPNNSGAVALCISYSFFILRVAAHRALSTVYWSNLEATNSMVESALPVKGYRDGISI